MGITQGAALARPAAMLNDSLGARPDGAISEDRQILATYVHGVFDEPAACAALLRWAGLHAPQHHDLAQLRARSIERLADALEQHLDLDALLKEIRWT
jgi:adenosylcobyric acid synthase